MKKITLILADDHAILRFGLRIYLSKCDDMQIVGEASTGEECLQLFEEKSPEICLIDIEMPQKSGLEVVRAIRKKDNEVKLLILSVHNDKKIIQKAFEAGSNGYLLKDTPKSEIAEAIRAIHRGQQVGNEKLTRSTNKTSTKETDLNELTNRELEILRLVVEGYSSPQIAEKLFISPRTVDTHRNNMMQKLNIKNTASLVRYALRNNLIELS